MSVKIRLRRMGERNTPFYRIVVTDSRSPVKGRFIETIGWYDPQRKGLAMEIKRDRMEYWTGNGAEVSQTLKTLVKKLDRGPAPAQESTPPQPEAPAPEAVTPAVKAEAPAPEAEAPAAETAADAEPPPAEDEQPAGEQEAKEAAEQDAEEEKA